MPAADRRPDFLLIGAQKAGTTWLWEMLDAHPGTQLPARKEIHYFGSAEYARRDLSAYLRHFQDVSPERVTGEASTALFFDRAPYWFDGPKGLNYDPGLPSIPRMVREALGSPRIIVILRDPVRRAVSAYAHWLRRGDIAPVFGLRRTARVHPKLRILEYGDYYRHLSAWRAEFPPEGLLVLNFERDVVGDPEGAYGKVCEFLGLESGFKPPRPDRKVHRSWSWTRSIAGYASGPLRGVVARGPIGGWLDRRDFLKRIALRRSDIEFLRARYCPEHERVAEVAGIDLSRWDYGAGLLDSGRTPGNQRGTG